MLHLLPLYLLSFVRGESRSNLIGPYSSILDRYVEGRHLFYLLCPYMPLPDVSIPFLPFLVSIFMAYKPEIVIYFITLRAVVTCLK